jgi:sulfur-oxidizing protein SoxZ
MRNARVKLPATIRAGDVIEVITMVFHPNESGFRLDNVGKPIPRHVITSFTCRYGGELVFSAALHPAIATNPYLSFYLAATHSGELEFTWRDDRGAELVERVPLRLLGAD